MNSKFLLVLAAMFTALALAAPHNGVAQNAKSKGSSQIVIRKNVWFIGGVPYPAGYVKFVHKGGYVANFKLSYEQLVVGKGPLKWVKKTLKWDKATLGKTKQFNIPPGTRYVEAFGEAYVLIGRTGSIFKKNYATTPKVTITAYGTTLNRKFSEKHEKTPVPPKKTSALPNWRLKPTYGAATIKVHNVIPHIQKLTAGGSMRTTIGGVNAHINNAPSFQVHYPKPGKQLIFEVEAKADTTLLVRLPNGTWAANDDGGKGRNPLISLAKPQAGYYQVWVGTYAPKTATATLRVRDNSPVFD